MKRLAPALSLSVALIAAGFGGAACDAPDGSPAEVVSQAQGTAPLCREVCGPKKACGQVCEAMPNPLGALPQHVTSCEFYTAGWCDGKGDWVVSNPSPTPPPQPSGVGQFCSQARPWEVVFFQHANFNIGWPLAPQPTQAALCRTFSVQSGTCAPKAWMEPWIETGGTGPSGFGFYNDQLSSVSIGAHVTLELFDHANFGGRTLLAAGANGMGAKDIPGLGSVQDQASSFIVRPNRPTRALRLFWSGAQLDNYSAASDQGQANARNAGYGDAGVMGYIETTRALGTLALRCYYNPANSDNLVTTDDPPAGYSPCGLGADGNVEGYIWGCGDAAVDLNLWYNPQRQDYHTVTSSFQSDAALSSQGYTKLKRLGKVLLNPR